MIEHEAGHAPARRPMKGAPRIAALVGER